MKRLTTSPLISEAQVVFSANAVTKSASQESVPRCTCFLSDTAAAYRLRQSTPPPAFTARMTTLRRHPPYGSSSAKTRDPQHSKHWLKPAPRRSRQHNSPKEHHVELSKDPAHSPAVEWTNASVCSDLTRSNILHEHGSAPRGRRFTQRRARIPRFIERSQSSGDGGAAAAGGAPAAVPQQVSTAACPEPTAEPRVRSAKPYGAAHAQGRCCREARLLRPQIRRRCAGV